MARATENIDLIIGGHTHTFLPKPTIVKNKQGKNMLVNQVGAYGINLGRVDFYFDEIEGTADFWCSNPELIKNWNSGPAGLSEEDADKFKSMRHGWSIEAQNGEGNTNNYYVLVPKSEPGADQSLATTDGQQSRKRTIDGTMSEDNHSKKLMN